MFQGKLNKLLIVNNLEKYICARPHENLPSGERHLEGYGSLIYKETHCLQTKRFLRHSPEGRFSCGRPHIIAIISLSVIQIFTVKDICKPLTGLGYVHFSII